MMRRQSTAKVDDGDKQALLLSQDEDVPILSDDMPYSHHAAEHHFNSQQHQQQQQATKLTTKKKRGWRSRLFGGGGGGGNASTSKKQQQQQQQQQRSKSAPRSTNRAISAPRLRQFQRQHHHQQQQQQPQVVNMSKSNDSESSRSQYSSKPEQREGPVAVSEHVRRSSATAAYASSPTPPPPLVSSLKKNKRSSATNKPYSVAANGNSSSSSAAAAIYTSHHHSNGNVVATSANHVHGRQNNAGHGLLVSSPTTTTTTSRNHVISTTTTSPTTRIQSIPNRPLPGVTNILKRPFGREVIVPRDQPWIVQVSPAEWEPDESLWKYYVHVQRRVQSAQEEILQDVTTNNSTYRSLSDFYWLQKALQQEFQGSLLLPDLSVTLGVPESFVWNSHHSATNNNNTTTAAGAAAAGGGGEVDSQLLTYWLSDIFNGIRGQGEWVLSSKASSNGGEGGPVNWLSCESMEAFLYRTDLLPMTDLPLSPAGGPGTVISSHHHSDNSSQNPTICQDSDGGTSSILKWVFQGEMCGISNAADDSKEETVTLSTYPSTQVPSAPSPRRRNIHHLPMISKQKLSSKALADARSLNVQNSFVVESSPTFDLTTSQKSGTPVAKYTHLLQAERDLVKSWRTRALHTMERLRIVQEEEKNIGTAWKRFAIALNNLFAYEKDIESVRLGDKPKSQLQMPFRKLQKSVVDDTLRVMAKQKLERCTPAWELLKTMLSTYVADLSAVQPSLEAYMEGIRQLSVQAERIETLRAAKPPESSTTTTTNTASAGTFLTDHIQAGLEQVKKQLVSGAAGDDSGDQGKKSREQIRLQQQELHLQMMERQLQTNEVMLKEYLTRLCQTIPVRTARMAYGYFQLEMKQNAAMHGAAVSMKSKVNVASRDVLSKMLSRHQQEIKEDRTNELQIVHRIVNIGNTKKFSQTDDGTMTEEIEQGVEINKEVENEKALLRDKTLHLCRERIGRWDSKVAMAIMEVVGVQDANVRVEETTRDLRLVRKHAIGLRENVQRCHEALEALRVCLLHGGLGNIRDLRQSLMAEIQTLFSGTYLPMEEPSTQLDVQALIEAGVSLCDPLGWRRREDGCGGAVNAYMDDREASTEWLLSSLGALLKEYMERVEAVESFVYMECVGIQLEKHFSQQRATALAAFEKKTDITSAINIATRKRMGVLVKELQAKLETVGPDVSHTTVKEAKESHLESKALKQELHDLSMRRLTRVRETSTEQVIALMSVWAKEEETAASKELHLLRDCVQVLEMSIGPTELDPYLEASPTDSDR